MLQEIERKIKEYFPPKWTKKNVLFWLGETRFDVDIEAINETLNKPVRDFILRGGKRWRPTLFLTSIALFGLNWKKYLDIAVALELAHNGTLIIDDIEDNAELRRGKPVFHKIFGVDVAINTGTTIHLLPLKILEKRKYQNEHQKLRILQIYNEEMTNVYFGQTTDIFWHNHPKDITINKYLEMCRLKTGGLIRMAVRMACVLANKREKFEDEFKKFAEFAGIAFQIKDDALEFISNEKTFGKSFGNDIKEGKLSLPVILALKKLDEDNKKKLLDILKSHTGDQKSIKQAVDMIKKSGAVEKSTEYADNLVNKAWEEIQIKLPKNHKEELNEFKETTYFLVKRDK